jgi:hypothetical protein
MRKVHSNPKQKEYYRNIPILVSEPEEEIIKAVRCITLEQLQRLIDFTQKMIDEAKGNDRDESSDTDIAITEQ